MVLAGCGEGDSKSTGTPAGSSGDETERVASAEDQIRALESDLVDAMLKRDGEAACKLMTSNAQAEIALAGAFIGKTGCAAILAEIARTTAEAEIKASRLTSIKVEGDRATATEKDGETTELVRVDGKWLFDGSPEEEQPTADDAKRWRATWCALKPGQPRDEVRKAMGPPTESDADSDKWNSFGYLLLAFYDPDLNVRQLDINEGPGLKCDETRTATE